MNETGEAFQRNLNRAERRKYIKANQTRGNRKYLVGFGNWRTHDGRQRTHARVQAMADPTNAPPRRERRAYMLFIYRAARKARSTRITPE